MRDVAYISDKIYLLHDTGAMHPESKARLNAIEDAVSPLKTKLQTPTPLCVSDEVLLTYIFVHR